MRAEFTVVEPHAKLSYIAKAWTEGREDATTIDQTTEVTLTEENGKTAVKVVAAIHNAGPEAGMAVQGMEYGFNQQMDKLKDFLVARAM